MSQQPGHPEENGHYGQYDQGNPGYGQQRGPQGYDQGPRGYDQGGPRATPSRATASGHGRAATHSPATTRATASTAHSPAGQPGMATRSSPVTPRSAHGAARVRPGIRPGRQGAEPGYGQQVLRPPRRTASPATTRAMAAGRLRPAGRRRRSPRPGLRGGAPVPVPAGLRPAAAAVASGNQQQLTATISMDDGSSRSYSLKRGHQRHRPRPGLGAFRLPDTGVSRRHLEISWDGHGHADRPRLHQRHHGQRQPGADLAAQRWRRHPGRALQPWSSAPSSRTMRPRLVRRTHRAWPAEG